MNKVVGNGTVYYNHSKKMWVAEYYIEENGIKKKKSIYGKNRDKVSKKLTTLMYDFHNDNFIKEKGIPLIKLLKQVREDKYTANLISDSHYARLEFVIKEIEKSDIGQTNIDKITTRDLQNYFNSLIERYTDSTIKKVWECVKQGFQYACKQKYIKENPFDDLLKPRSRKKTKDVDAITIEQQEILYNYLRECDLDKEKYKNVILIQLYTGMRVGEVLALSLEDIDFDNSIIYVRKTVSVDREGNLVVKQGTKTYAGNRELPLPDYLENSFKEQINVYEDNPEHLLFTYERRIIKASTINTVLKRICKQLGLPYTISNHTLRHTYGTRCIESGMLPVAVQKLMGHKDIRVTLNTYTTVLNKLKVDELNKVTKHYLENNLMVKPDKDSPIQITNSNIKVTETNKQYTYALETEVVKKQITKADITNYYKELAKWANRQYK